MTASTFFHVDAFAAAPFTGNPAGVVLLDRWRDEAELQRIAAELNLPATAFTVPAAGAADYEIRWFSPDREIGLCGHGTLAAGHALIGGAGIVRFATRAAGMVSVARDGDQLCLSLPAIAAAPKYLSEAVELIGGEPVETLWHERGYGILRYANEAQVRALAPDFERLAQMGDVQFSATAPGRETDIASRVFTSRGGEDAVTGSAHAVLTPYWAEKLCRPSFTATQASLRGGRLDCRLDGDYAVLGGRCVTVVEGRLVV